MEQAGAADRAVPSAAQDRASQSAPDHRGHHLAAQERGALAGHPGGTGAVVDGRADLPALEPPWRLGTPAGTGAGARRRRTGDGLSRRHQHSRPPQGRRRGQKGGSSARRDEREALGRSRGGFGTKACVIADAAGRAIGFALAPGQAHELPLAPLLLTLLTIIPLWIVGDRGYASQAFRGHCQLGPTPFRISQFDDYQSAEHSHKVAPWAIATKKIAQICFEYP